MILLIDNYDSFSYNLYQYLGSINSDIKVIRNDELNIEEIKALNPSHIVISPGPGKPSNSGIIEDVVRYIDKPILGVCLGHQAICEVFGSNIVHAPVIMQGKKDLINVDNSSTLFKGLDKVIEGARYHSLVADKVSSDLKITATTADGIIMGVEHVNKKIYGIQFHPESVMTKDGMKIIKNFLEVK